MLKPNEWDSGTLLRTILVVATSLNTALMATDLTGFENPTVNFIYKIVSIVLNFIIVGISAYFNNDFTKNAQVGTTVTRTLKSDPTVVVEMYDGDEDEDDEDVPEVDEKGDETIEEGETDEVEQK